MADGRQEGPLMVSDSHYGWQDPLGEDGRLPAPMRAVPKTGGTEPA